VYLIKTWWNFLCYYKRILENLSWQRIHFPLRYIIVLNWQNLHAGIRRVHQPVRAWGPCDRRRLVLLKIRGKAPDPSSPTVGRLQLKLSLQHSIWSTLLCSDETPQRNINVLTFALSPEGMKETPRRRITFTSSWNEISTYQMRNWVGGLTSFYSSKDDDRFFLHLWYLNVWWRYAPLFDYLFLRLFLVHDTDMRRHITLWYHEWSELEAAGSWIEVGLQVVCSELTCVFLGQMQYRGILSVLPQVSNLYPAHQRL
jgi:hypothetical protein